MKYRSFGFAPILCMLLLECALVDGPNARLQNVALSDALQAGTSLMSRNDEIAYLLQVIRDTSLRKNDPAKVVDAIQKLGSLRAVEATPDLVGLLTFQRRFAWETKDGSQEIQPITTANRYPAVGALFQIGEPALPALLGVIENSPQDTVESRNATETIMYIFREKCLDGIRFISPPKTAGKLSTSHKRRIRASKWARSRWCMIPIGS
jgi:hypothetical protein